MRLSGRALQAAYLLTVTLLFWLGMQVFHELGHVLGALATGAEILRVVLHPLKLSETVLGRNPEPALVAFTGTLAGSGLPLLLYGFTRTLHLGDTALQRAFAGFCLIANGVYLVFGPSTGPSDTGVMVTAGWSGGLLRTAGLLLAGTGIYLWNGLGRYFGMGEARGQVRRSAFALSLFLLALLVLLELIFQP